MDSANLSKSHWNETPLFYSEDARYKIYPWLPEVAEFSQHAGHKVLEVGCGTGSDLLQFAKHGAEAHGIDITEEHLRLAKQRVGDLATVQYGDGRAIPYPDATFDYVYSHGVIHHSDEPHKIAAEIMRVLKPGGSFNIHAYSLVSLTTISGYVRYRGDFKRRIENSRAPVHIDLYTKGTFRKLFPVPLKFSKHHARLFPSILGWYLVAKGRKP